MSTRVVKRDDQLRATVVAVRALVDPTTGERVGAASAAVRDHDRLFCVEDDALSATWVDPVSLRIERVVLLGEGERLPKSRKADFEAAFRGPDGDIFVLGSGSTDRRRRIARHDPTRGVTTVIDAGPLYDAIAARLTVPPNIEGAALLGDIVRLFHRANGRGAGRSASFDVPLSAIETGAGDLLSETTYDLGGVDGATASVALTFTDAAPLTDGRVMYLAAAEDCEDAIADGPVLGAAVGVLEADGGRYALLTEQDGSPSRRKIEGVALMPEERRAYLVTDPDDPEKAAELCSVLLEGPW